MTKTELEFLKQWEVAHEGLQLTVSKRREMQALAREWFFRGVDYTQEKLTKVMRKQMYGRDND